MGFVTDFLKLYESAPHQALFNMKPENSDYCCYAVGNKNSYLLSGSDWNEDCYYGRWLNYCRDCTDTAMMFKCELCYECVDCENCFNCNFSQECRDSNDLSYCYDCIGCNNLFGCAGQRHKSHMIFNEQFSKEEYAKKLAELKMEARSREGRDKIWRKFEECMRAAPRRFARLVNTENCQGDYMTNSKNCFHCFDMTECEDCTYSNDAYEQKDTHDSSFIAKGELLYECFSHLGCNNNRFCHQCLDSHDCEYSFLMYNCDNCFGCVSLHRKSFHILNQPYSKEVYVQRVAEIKNEMRAEGSYGRFFIPSPYPFQVTTASWFWPE